MNTPPAAAPRPAPPALRQPCTEACAAFRPLATDRWTEFGVCVNARSPRRGYPVRLGRDCRYFQAKTTAA